jgi:hypothetical protein
VPRDWRPGCTRLRCRDCGAGSRSVQSGGRRGPVGAQDRRGRGAARIVIFHSPVRLRRDRRPARSDIQCPNDSPLRHRSDVRSDISLSKRVSERRSEPIARAREFGFGQSKPMSQLVFGQPLSLSKRERVQTKMSEREGRQGRSGSEHQDCRAGAGCRARARNRRSFFGNFPPAPFSTNG